jgi:hypothetical protein
LAKTISQNESAFNHSLIWPILELAVDCPELENDANFIPGEILLKSSLEEYLTDAVIIRDSGEEILLLETSGKYKLKDVPRFGYDHIKGCFGVLTMLSTIIKRNHMASIDTIIKLSLPFVHAKDT